MRIAYIHVTALLIIPSLLFSGCQPRDGSSKTEGHYAKENGSQRIDVDIRHVASGQATLRAIVSSQAGGQEACSGDTDTLPAKVIGNTISVSVPGCRLTFITSANGGGAEIREADCAISHGSSCSFDENELAKVVDEPTPLPQRGTQDETQGVPPASVETGSAEDVFSKADAWNSDWGSGIRATVKKTACTDPVLKDGGYQYLAYSTIPKARVKSESQIWFVVADRAVTVTGCWKYIGNGLGHYKMSRKKDGKVFEDDINLADGGWLGDPVMPNRMGGETNAATDQVSGATPITAQTPSLPTPPAANAANEAGVIQSNYSDYPYYAEITCTVNKSRLLVSACFNGNIPGGTELELRNGNDYGLYKFYEIMRLGKQVNNALIIDLHEHFSIVAQPSNNRMILGIKLVERASGETLFEKQTTFFQVISVSN